ncbi:MAG: DUF6029 family protein [Mangrovibacterium sp.]
MRTFKLVLPILLVIIFGITASAQRKGVLSGGLETNNIYYQSDSKTNAEVPDNKIGSNNYLRLDYTLDKIQVGVQYEGYFPALVGYNKTLDGSKITNRYASYTDDRLSFMAGHFYEQYGSGLILRTYEERSLGINNAIDGVRVALSPIEGFKIKGLVGKQRKFLDESAGKLYGIDSDINVNEFLTEMPIDVNIGGSWVNKYETNTSAQEIPTSVNSYAFRASLGSGGFSLDGEYVYKDKDPNFSNEYNQYTGEALLLNLGYTKKRLGTTLTFRRLEYMDFRSERDATGEAVMINYLPALTRQHRYALASLNPYATSVNGEIGGQFDLYYRFKKGSALGGKYGTLLQVNYSQYHNLDINKSQFFYVNEKLFSDFSIDIEKKWNSKLKTIGSFINQYYNKSVISSTPDIPVIKSSVIVADLQYKIGKKTSIRTELQQLFTKQDEKNWAMALIEFNYAPRWGIYVSDMYNYGSSKTHYYNVGGTYTRGNTRCLISYARNRKGIQCVGGICRDMPAYTGLNLSITSRF